MLPPRIAGRSRWPLTAALVALLISVPALAVAQRSSTSRSAAAKKKKKAVTRGPRGARGPRGLQGFTGRAGKDGIGSTGPVGPKGDKGEAGDQTTQVFTVAMAAGDPDRTLVHYPPFDVIARCTLNNDTSFSATLVAKTSTDDSYLATQGATGAQDAADFDIGSGEKVLGSALNEGAASAAATHGPWTFFLSSAPGTAVTGQFSIGTNVFAPGGQGAKACLFTGTLTR